MFYNRSIQKKLFLLFLIATLIPLLTLGYFSYEKSKAIVNEQFRNYNKYAIQQLKLLLDTHLLEMEHVSRNIASYLLTPSRDIQYKADSYRGFLENKFFLDLLKNQASANIHGLFVISPEGEVYGKRVLNYEMLQDEEWWKSVMPEDEGRFWVGFHESDYYILSIPKETVISLIIPIRLEGALPKGSKILIEIKTKAILELLSSFEKDTNSYVFIRDTDGNTIYQSKEDYKPADTDLVWKENLELSNWTIEARVPNEEYKRSSEIIRDYAFIISIFSLVIASIFAHWFTKKFTSRIINLNKSMLEVSQGKLNTQISVESQDELGRLANRFNYMTNQISHLIDDISQSEKLKNKAELRALHYQINPHLMMNTLNSIQWKARLNGQKDIELMIYHLTEVLAESLDASQELVPLSKELETVSHYLKIQEYRYGNVFEYEQKVPLELTEVLIPRMTLQPLFENIFYHALTDGTGKITLAVVRRGANLELILSDNGAGISTDRIPRLNEPTVPSKGRGGLGMYNVDQKFKLHYGDHYGLKMSSKPNIGTQISIHWPQRGKNHETS